MAVPHSIDRAIRLASAVYGVPRWQMVAVARCETGGDFNPRSYNRWSHASGLFQFLPSTWRRTPFAGFDVFDPYANALAAAWLVQYDSRHPKGSNGWREWTCQP